MGLKGAAIGGIAGWMFGGPLGALLGAYFGNSVEKGIEEAKKPGYRKRRPSDYSSPRYSDASSARQDMIFCASAAALLAKMAKADGVVTRDEIRSVETAFERLGFSKLTRDYAINVFRKAKDDGHTIFEYAYNFASAVPSVEVRELLYELLWDVACADGVLSAEEMAYLRQLPLSLGIRPAWFEFYARERIRGYQGGDAGGGRRERREQRREPPRDQLAEAYELLGVSASDDDATLKKRYRELAKKYHPDALKAQGLPDEMIGKATEKMAKINAAWSEIKAARGL